MLLAAIIPIKSYSNTEAEKDKILQENKDKSGIYIWTNNINNKKYIGSSENLRRRFLQYFNTNYLIKDNCMQICRALLKHGYSNFSLTILEYCEPLKCLEREGFYQKKLNPEYNISQDPAAPFSGRTHSDESKIIMSDAKKGENNPMFGKTGENHPNFGQLRPKGAGSPSQQIEVTDITNNTTTSYDSMSAAARALNINIRRISNYFVRNQEKPYKGQYTFKKL